VPPADPSERDRLALLKPALLRALVVARAGREADPVVLPPRAILALLRFRNLPRTALSTVATTIESDDPFRERVAEGASERDLGRASWLWLTRPEGWEDEFERFLAAASLAGPAAGGGTSDPRADRRVEGAERAAQRAEARAAAAEAELATVRADLDAARRAAADARHAAQVAGEGAADRSRAVRELKQVEVLAAQRLARVRALEAEVSELAQRLAEAEERVAASEAARSSGGALAGPSPQAAAAALGALDAALEAARAVLGPFAPASTQEPAPPGPDASTEAASPPRRRPEPIPGGRHERDAETAAHLLGRGAVTAVIDGYNVSKTAWPHATPFEQRFRLLALVGEVAARRPGLEAEIVFDGAEVGAVVPDKLPRGVSVRFSPPDIEADDIVIGRIAQVPLARVAVAVSSDRRVRDGARRLGGNVIAADQFLALAGPPRESVTPPS